MIARPLRLPLRLARMHVPVRINGDVGFFQGVMKVMLEEESRAPGSVLDRAFMAEHTVGFEALAATLETRPWRELQELRKPSARREAGK